MPVVLDDHVSRLAQVTAVDHHIAGHDEAKSAGSPAPVQLDEPMVGALGGVAETLAEGRLHEPIAQNLARGKGEGIV